MLVTLNPERYIGEPAEGEQEHLEMCRQQLGRADHLNPQLSTIVLAACIRWGSQPSMILRDRALLEPQDNKKPARTPGIGRFRELTRMPFVVLSRRATWALAGKLTDRPPHEIASLIGGHSLGYVTPYIEMRPGTFARSELRVVESLAAALADEACFDT